MRTVLEPRDLSELVATEKRSHKKIAMVPTMGALHRGHSSLIELARSNADFVVVSIFVNSLQFDQENDFNNYPVQLEKDAELLRALGADVLYSPTAATMYGPDFGTGVRVGKIVDSFEGRSRPGHFDGVATVVTKLLASCQPDIAVFGQKDFQQFAVIAQLVGDLNLPVDLLLAPTIRDTSGLALSSRNVRLSTDGTLRAASISQGLFRAQTLFDNGQSKAAQLVEIVEQTIHDAGAIDYVAVVNPRNLTKVEIASKGDVILVAVEIDGVRLIDNLILT